jgi:hypothetical protein
MTGRNDRQRFHREPWVRSTTTIALTQVVEGGEIELLLPDSVWTPSGGNVDFSQGALTLQITAISQTFTLECLPDGVPQPFETTSTIVRVPSLGRPGLILLVLGVLVLGVVGSFRTRFVQ